MLTYLKSFIYLRFVRSSKLTREHNLLIIDENKLYNITKYESIINVYVFKYLFSDDQSTMRRCEWVRFWRTLITSMWT